ncbi:MmgE/PrpD family protein [Zoogloea sp.]|uniref:MmgE/PrpD family protein n=1 Tax=Zoogloea sp. TaxID=49181 RepID=UPI0014162D21|nr:MAG: MmgE/PrpD family protein [Zoogloea sp.]
MDTTSRALAEYAVSMQRAPLPAGSADAVTRHLIDSVACAFGALESRPARVARAIAGTATSSTGASVFGLAQPTTPEYAAFANTVMIRYLDYNDTGNGGHPSDMMSAVLALGEARGAGGSQVIRAVHAAYETYAAVRRGGLYGNLLRDKHVDQVYAILGAVAGAGVMLELSLEQMAHAIALALTPSIPMRVTRTGLISDWKGCATAHGTMNAVFAARLAGQGLTGPDRPFEGLAGFYEMFGLAPLDLTTLGQPRNGRSALQSTGLKYYPADYNGQGPIALTLALREEARLEDIDQIIVSVHWGGWHAIGGGAGDHDEKWDPQTREVADHSMAYLVAAALVDGDLNVDSFSASRLADPALRPLMQKIVVRDDPELTREHAGELPRWPSRVEFVLKDGRRLGRSSGPPKGHPLNPMDDRELKAKFWRMSDRVLNREQGQAWLDTLWALPALADIRALTGLYRSLPAAT